MTALLKIGKSLLFVLLVLGAALLASTMQQPKVVADTGDPVITVVVVIKNECCCCTNCPSGAMATAVPTSGSYSMPTATPMTTSTGVATSTAISKTAIPINTPVATNTPVPTKTNPTKVVPTSTKVAPTVAPTTCGQNPGNEKCVGNSQSKKFTATPGAGEVGDSDTDGKKDKDKKDK